jgi:hypothetical protein
MDMKKLIVAFHNFVDVPKNHTLLAYADDILSQSKTHIIETVNKIETEATKFGLIVKNEKTKILQLIRNTKLHTET